MAPRRRLDQELVRRGLVTSRAQAHEAIDNGLVIVNGAPAAKSARLVDPAEPIRMLGPPKRFVSRGGDKLAAALHRFGVDPSGRRCLDIGASTGGFTDCLLQGGAAWVAAVDVGHGQLHERIRADPRVRVMERCHAISLDPSELGGPVDLVVVDVSFISVTRLSSVFARCCAPGGHLVVLVKPQFEAGRAEVSKGRGVIRSAGVWRETLGGVHDALVAQGFRIDGVMESPIRGAEGNVEFLLHGVRVGAGEDLAEAGAIGLSPVELDEVVAAVDAGQVAGASGEDTAPLGASAGTAPLGASAGTAPLGASASTAPLGASASTAPLGASAGTAPLGASAGTAPLGATPGAAQSGRQST